MDMDGIFNTVSNLAGEYAANTGNSIMSNGDIAILSVRSYKCSEGTCAGPNGEGDINMLVVEDLFGEIKCVEDSGSCILNGENAARVMFVWGTGTGTLVLRAISFKDGDALYGGGVYIDGNDGSATVDIELCIFINCTATDQINEWGGGAISVYESGAAVSVYGTSFVGNTADSGNGADIENDLGTITIHSTCPSPYSSITPIQGKMENEDYAVCRTIPDPTIHLTLPLHQHLPLSSHRVHFGHLWHC
jgi:hypothetical protein